MDDIVSYAKDGPVVNITLDDGKANALSPRMLAAVNAALDQAEADGAVVVLAGREGLLSAGFDLKILRAGGAEANGMVRGGFELSERLLAFPTPVVVACTGHAIAMASFLLLSGDYRIGAAGEFRIVANEVAIGIPMPYAAIELCRHRLAPAHFNRAVLLAETYSPEGAVAAGFLDRVVAPSEVVPAAQELAAGLAQLNLHAHAATKQRLRDTTLTDLRAGMKADEETVRAAAG